MKYMKQFFSAIQNKYVFSTNDVKRYGYYSFYDDIMLTGFSYYPSYYGLESTLFILKLWEQETNPVIITPLHVRTGLMQFNGGNYSVRKMSRQLFFGYTHVKYFDFYIPVFGVENTLIDFVYYNEKIPPQLFIELKANANKKIIKTYISRITDNRIRNKILKSMEL